MENSIQYQHSLTETVVERHDLYNIARDSKQITESVGQNTITYLNKPSDCDNFLFLNIDQSEGVFDLNDNQAFKAVFEAEFGQERAQTYLDNLNESVHLIRKTAFSSILQHVMIEILLAAVIFSLVTYELLFTKSSTTLIWVAIVLIVIYYIYTNFSENGSMKQILIAQRVNELQEIFLSSERRMVYESTLNAVLRRKNMKILLSPDFSYLQLFRDSRMNITFVPYGFGEVWANYME